MPWQQYFYDVFGEVDPKTGIRVYRECAVSAMRQVGKTTGVRVAKAHRALDTTTPQLIQFAAQDGIEAKKKWLAHAKLIKKSPLADRLLSLDEPVTSNGKEALNWANGSVEFPISSKPDSGHGDTLHLGVVTEAWSLQDDRYENTMLPAMNIVPDAQLLIESTEGTAQSLYWNARVDEQRARYEADPHAPGRTMFLDWSFGPDDDPGDPETWLRRIPSLGYTLRLEEVQYAYDRATTPAKMRQFLRGFGNIRDLGAAEGTMFEESEWEDGADPESRIIGDITFALEISPDRSFSTVGVAGTGSTGGFHVGIAQRHRGTYWVIEYLVRKMAELNATTIYVAAGSPAALMVPDLERAGLTVVVIPRNEVAAACGGIYDDIREHNLHYTPGQTDLDLAVSGAVWTGGDVRTFSRGSSSVDISPLYAVTLARYGSILARQENSDILSTIA
ncbi:MAG: hypothetical protein KF861_00440 [Planctomycetaceae bacterium]|nr:hypothetical protein [Planctomycetaceae bacterium]